MQAVRRALVLGPVMAMIASLLGAGVAQAARPPAAPLASFTTPNAYEWTVPKGVRRVTFLLRGAAGGSMTIDGSTGNGGLGGETRATLNVVPGQLFEIVVGGQGVFTAAGSNGGGSGSYVSTGTGGGGGEQSGGGGGGGASDVRAGGCAATLSCGLAARLLVAGGGGGAGGASGSGVTDGGAGGGLAGSAAAGGGGGGTQTSGGSTGALSEPGSFGSGGAGPDTNDPLATIGGAGGGGGWFGGGGAAEAGGGGGSAFITSLALSGSTQTGVWSGDGQVLIYKG